MGAEISFLMFHNLCKKFSSQFYGILLLEKMDQVHNLVEPITNNRKLTRRSPVSHHSPHTVCDTLLQRVNFFENQF